MNHIEGTYEQEGYPDKKQVIIFYKFLAVPYNHEDCKGDADAEYFDNAVE